MVGEQFKKKLGTTKRKGICLSPLLRRHRRRGIGAPFRHRPDAVAEGAGSHAVFRIAMRTESLRQECIEGFPAPAATPEFPDRRWLVARGAGKLRAPRRFFQPRQILAVT